MQFYKEKMLLNDFCKHAEDLCVILKHVGAKMQFYKVKCRKKDAVHANEGLECKNQKIWDKNAMQ